MTARRAAFTLLEICLTVAIGALLIMLAVPSVSGLLAEQRLHDSYARFQDFAGQARVRSVRDHKPVVLMWGEHDITLCTTDRDAHGDPVVVDRLGIAEKETIELERPAALAKRPAAEWVFWPNGTCEPVVVSYKGPSGSWQVSFDALTAHGTFLRSEAL